MYNSVWKIIQVKLEISVSLFAWIYQVGHMGGTFGATVWGPIQDKIAGNGVLVISDM